MTTMNVDNEIANLAQAAVDAGVIQIKKGIRDAGWTRQQVEGVLNWLPAEEDRALLWIAFWEMDEEEAW